MKLIELVKACGTKNEFLGFFRNLEDFTQAHETILNACYDNQELSLGIIAPTETSLAQKWMDKYKKGFENRISRRISNMPGTCPDDVIDLIIHSRLRHLSDQDLKKIKFAHRLSMSAENILGLLLEEYLADELLEFGWFCAWGDTIRHVDFCNKDGRLLQIKNRSNSENSSSSRVRLETNIVKWFRVDARTNTFKWDELNIWHKTSKFSEKKFHRFVINALAKNPLGLPVEPENPWLNP
ncbi:SinI family restriction endonuclease [bacterium]|nr:SinI family restriction endonuclease [bacterium]